VGCCDDDISLKISTDATIDLQRREVEIAATTLDVKHQLLDVADLRAPKCHEPRVHITVSPSAAPLHAQVARIVIAQSELSGSTFVDLRRHSSGRRTRVERRPERSRSSSR
jgi:hypothetical protein